MGGNGQTPDDREFENGLAELGFTLGGASRRGGTMWTLEFNRFLEFTLHDYGETVVFTWSFALGEYLLEKGWQIGAGETTFQELYPQRDVRLPVDIEAVEAEIRRVLGTMRLDLGDPGL